MAIKKALVWCSGHDQLEEWGYDPKGRIYYSRIVDDKWITDYLVLDPKLEDALSDRRMKILYKFEE